MTGTTLTITVADEAIQEKLQALIRAGEALSPVFEKIGETLAAFVSARQSYMSLFRRHDQHQIKSRRF